MKNKAYIWTIAIFVLIVLGVWKNIGSRTERTNMAFAKNGKIIFVYEGFNITHDLSDDEMNTIKNIFDNKTMYVDNLSCGFSDEISVKFNDSQTFCFARDTCPIVYWKEAEKFIELTETEKQELYNLLKGYGFIFPCV